MKAMQKTKSKKLLSERVTAMEGDPRGAFATWRRRMAGRTRSIFIVLRHGILSLYSYIRKFVPWRSRTYIQNLRHVRIAGVTSSFLFGLLALAIIIPLYNVSGTEDTEAASSYVPSTSSITFTSTRNKASINLTPTSTTGTFVQSDTTNTSEVASFNVTTNNATGYTLGIASSTDTTSLTNGTDTLPTITNASSGITAATFNTSTYNDMWGYLPSKYNSAPNTGSSAKFYPITTTTATLDETAAANSTANTYTIALGARVTMTKSSGTYTTPTGTAFVLTAVGKPASYSITYNQNTTDTVSNLPDPTGVQSTSAQSITLSSTAPTRSNYNFLGWCTAQLSDQTNGTSGSTACSNASGTYYAAGGTFYIDETTKNVTTIYAMWEQASVTITFKANGGTGSDYTQTVTPGNSINLSGNSFTRSNYYFKGWGTDTSAVAYRPGQSITPSRNMILYAIWGSSTSTSLYNIVASLNNSRTLDNTTTNGTGLSAKAGIQATITKDNSGVFSYNSSTFGTASDASTSNTIYLYRGILDNVEGTYGSNGDGGNYPNYVKLSNNTCWRILRTTGSGGVKLIYNGTYGATTSGSCANATTRLTTKAFDATANSFGKSIVGVGYTYNASYKSTTDATAAGTVFGTNASYSGNTSPSTMKTYIEDTWYKSNMTSYTSKLEPSAGYCNDRSLYASGSYTTALSESTTIVPYGTSGLTEYYFGAFARNSNSAQKPSLTCPRNVVDLYTTASASNGNKQLTYPVALATADEMSFAGSGNSAASNGSSYNAKSFALSGAYFWFLSPYYRTSNGFAYGYILRSGGYLGDNGVSSTNGVRPVISLTSGTTPASGSGTATDPWVVTPPPTMQDATSSSLATLMPNVGDTATLVDSRDGEAYLIGHLADGKYWMLDNLRLGSTSTISLNSSTTNLPSDVTWTLPASGTVCLSFTSCTGTDGTTTGTGYSVPAINTTSKDTVASTKYGSGSGKIGVYYNYCAASAGSICKGNNSSNGSPNRDICPKGWRIPTGGSSGEYQALYTAYSSDASNFRAALSTPLSGYFDNAAYNQGYGGLFWSSTRNDNQLTYDLSVYSSNVDPKYSVARNTGSSVRCVLK